MQESNFYDLGRWLPGDWSVAAGSARPDADLPGTLQMHNIFTIGGTYKIYVSVIECSTPDVGIIVQSGAFVFGLINDVGVYEFEFTADITNLTLLCSPSGDNHDVIRLNNIQIFRDFGVDLSSGDVELDPSLLEVYNYGDVDYVFYCGASLGKDLPPCSYYSIIKSGDKYFFSEIFTVKSFLPESSPYFILEWKNTCDINNIIYSGSNCEYKNRLYLDEAVISKPEYPIQEEGQNDGNQNFVPTFQKWEKKVDFIIARCPEFIVDALTGIRLHDTVTVTRPLRLKQIINDDPILIRSIETELTPVFNDCYTNVDVKLLLDDKYVDTTCCTNNEKTECSQCTNYYDYIDALPIVPTNGDIILVTMSSIPGPVTLYTGWYIYDSISSTYVRQPDVNGFIICAHPDAKDLFTFIWELGVWYRLPSINYFIYDTLSETFNLEGVIWPGSFAQLEFSIDSGPWIVYPPLITDGEFFLGLGAFPYPDPHVIQNIKFRVHNFTLNCNYGYTSEQSYDFAGNAVQFNFINGGGTMTPGEDITNTAYGNTTTVYSNDGATMIVNDNTLSNWAFGNVCNNIDGDEITINSVPILVRV